MRNPAIGPPTRLATTSPSVATLHLSPSGDFFEDVSGGGGPDERFGFDVVLLEIGFDCRLEFSDAAEDAAADGVAGDQAEEAFDQIDPGGRGRGEVEVEAGVALEPSLDLGVLVRRVVVDDEMPIERFGGVAVDLALGAESAGTPDGDGGSCIRR